LREPISSVRFETLGNHCHITVWTHGGNSGTLIVAKEDAVSFARMFSDRCDDPYAPIGSHFGGADVGMIITENVRGLDPHLQLIDEYGDVWTVEEVRAKAGKGKVAP